MKLFLILVLVNIVFGRTKRQDYGIGTTDSTSLDDYAWDGYGRDADDGDTCSSCPEDVLDKLSECRYCPDDVLSFLRKESSKCDKTSCDVFKEMNRCDACPEDVITRLDKLEYKIDLLLKQSASGTRCGPSNDVDYVSDRRRNGRIYDDDDMDGDVDSKPERRNKYNKNEKKYDDNDDDDMDGDDESYLKPGNNNNGRKYDDDRDGYDNNDDVDSQKDNGKKYEKY